MVSYSGAMPRGGSWLSAFDPSFEEDMTSAMRDTQPMRRAPGAGFSQSPLPPIGSQWSQLGPAQSGARAAAAEARDAGPAPSPNSGDFKEWVSSELANASAKRQSRLAADPAQSQVQTASSHQEALKMKEETLKEALRQQQAQARGPEAQQQAVKAALAQAAKAAAPAARRLHVIHFNDTYNMLPQAAEDPVGGATRFATLVRQLRSQAAARGEEVPPQQLRTRTVDPASGLRIGSSDLAQRCSSCLAATLSGRRLCRRSRRAAT